MRCQVAVECGTFIGSRAHTMSCKAHGQFDPLPSQGYSAMRLALQSHRHAWQSSCRSRETIAFILSGCSLAEKNLQTEPVLMSSQSRPGPADTDCSVLSATARTPLDLRCCLLKGGPGAGLHSQAPRGPSRCHSLSGLSVFVGDSSPFAELRFRAQWRLPLDRRGSPTAQTSALPL